MPFVLSEQHFAIITFSHNKPVSNFASHGRHRIWKKTNNLLVNKACKVNTKSIWETKAMLEIDTGKKTVHC